MNAAVTGNIFEENTAFGNTNGIFITAGVQGNIFRGNLATGNSPVQVTVDHAAAGGFDIKNLATAGANAFEANICLTSVNAPCPSTGPTLTANPNPIPVTSSALFGMTTISWNAPDAQVIEIHVGSPTGPLFAEGGNRGSAQTGLWVSDGTAFYLQDVTDGKPLNSDYTLATLLVRLQRPGQASLTRKPRLWVVGASAIPLFGLVVCGLYWRRFTGGKTAGATWSC